MVIESRRARAVFLDRDGVLTVPEFRDGRSFAPRRLEDFRLYDDAREATSLLKEAGFRLVVVTNQPDVGHGRIAPAVGSAEPGVRLSTGRQPAN
jgi:D-glycero-D-manno-heptose 1,7-bisphosphate phosphatase